MAPRYRWGTKQQATPEAPPRALFQAPSFPYGDWAKQKWTVQSLVTHERRALRQAKFPDALCARAIDVDAQDRAEALRAFASDVIAPVVPALFATSDALQRNDSSTNAFLKLAAVLYRAPGGDVREGMLWLAAEAMAARVCGMGRKPDEREAQALAVALVHTATSKTATGDLLYAVFGRVPQLVDTRQEFFWSAQTNARELVSDLIASLLPKLGDGNETGVDVRSARLALGHSSIPVACHPDVQVVGARGPALSKQGATLANDTSFFLRLHCENRSSDTRLISESLLTQGGGDGVFDGTGDADTPGELVFPELDPGETSVVTLGPILLSSLTSGAVTLRYQLVSSQHQDAADLAIELNSVDSFVSLKAGSVVEDLPGSSVVDNVPGLRAGARAEAELLVQAEPAFEVSLSKLAAAEGARGERVEVEVEPAARFGPATDAAGWQHLTDDVDLSISAAATDVRALRPGNSVLATDASHFWLRSSLHLTTSCKEDAKSLKGEVQSAYMAVCNAVPFESFAALLLRIRAAGCRSVQAEAAATPKTANEAAPSVGIRWDSVVDPSYADVEAAIATLVDLNVLSETDLTRALEHLDELVSTPLFHASSPVTPTHPALRERSRQLVIAADVAALRHALLGATAFTRGEHVDVFKTHAPEQILQLKREIVEIALRAEVARAKESLESAARAASQTVTPEATTLLLAAGEQLSNEVACDRPANLASIGEPGVSTILFATRYVALDAEASR